jgi:O-antigen ligase
MDEWQYALPYSRILGTQYPHITAWIGNPSHLAVYLVICLPFVIEYCRWYWVATTLLAIYLCHSDTALFGALFCLTIGLSLRMASLSQFIGRIFNFNFCFRKIAVAIGLLILALFAAILAVFINIENHKTISFADSGRFEVWKNGIEDWKSAPYLYLIPENASESTRIELEAKNRRSYMLTGRGLGSWAFMYPIKHPQENGVKWDTAHNEYLETLYSIGIAGLFLLLMAIWQVLYGGIMLLENKFWRAAYLAFLISLLCAAVHPVWHMEPHRYIIVFLFAILSGKVNNERKTGKKV